MTTDRNGPLASAWAKYDRAREHAQETREALSAWRDDVESPPWLPEQQFNADENCFIYTAGYVGALPTRWPLLISDTLTNLRAALDHLAWYLVSIGSDPPQTVTEKKAVMFPIALTEAAFKSQAGGGLKGVDTDLRAIVKRHQPYHWGDVKDEHPFAVLNDFVRHDKHRMLQLVFGRFGDTRVIPQPSQTFMPERLEPGPVLRGGILQPGAEIVRIYGRRMGAGDPEVKVCFESFTSICLENGVIVTDLLEWSLASVAMLLAEFDTVFWARHYAAQSRAWDASPCQGRPR